MNLDFDPIAEARRQWEARGWDDAAAGMAAVTSVVRAHQIFVGRIDTVLAPFGLTFARYELLQLLSFTRAGCLPMGKIGARLQVHAASVTNAVNRLEADGLVRREAHPDDGRTTLACITTAGKRVATDATAALNAEVFGALELSDRDLASLFRILEALRRRAGDFA